MRFRKIIHFLCHWRPGLFRRHPREGAEHPAPPTPTQPTPAQTTSGQTTGNGTYVVVDPLANVRYDNRYDVSLGLAYDHMKAGPTLLQGSNLGGLDVERLLLAHQALGRRRLRPPLPGHQRRRPQRVNTIGGHQGPLCRAISFPGGAEWLGPHNKHGALIAHALVRRSLWQFEKDLRGQSPSVVDFYNNQLAPAAIIGGHMDLNRSAHWVFRITPDAVMTHYGINYGSEHDPVRCQLRHLGRRGVQVQEEALSRQYALPEIEAIRPNGWPLSLDRDRDLRAIAGSN